MTKPRVVHTSAEKKSVAAIASAWVRRNELQLVGRSGLGGTPCSFSVFAIVDLATVWPSLFSSPWIRQ